jgi:hypothetical protein
METGDLIRSAIRAGYKSPQIGLHRKQLEDLIAEVKSQKENVSKKEI